MKILIAGASGMIGSRLAPYLAGCGHEVIRLVRHDPGEAEVFWDPGAGRIDIDGLEGFDGVVESGQHALAGQVDEKGQTRNLQ